MKHRHIKNIETLLKIIEVGHGTQIPIRLKGGAYYVSMIDYKLHTFDKRTLLAEVVDVYCDTIMMEESQEIFNLDLIAHLTDN